MDFNFSERVAERRQALLTFMDQYVYPNEETYFQQVARSGDRHFQPPIMEELKAEAKKRDLWNLFLPNKAWGAGLSNLEYAPLAELTGRSPMIAPEALNCSAPDTGNMEILAEFGSEEQQRQWLVPLLSGEIRSAFLMTEPDVASSDATNVQTRIAGVGDEYVINGRKWWSTGVASPRCKIAILMGKTSPDADTYHQQSFILVPLDTPGVEVVRELPIYGHYDGKGGHCEVRFTDVRVPRQNLIHDEGSGFALAQARLGPGRIHHCMRLIGMAERAFDLMCERTLHREAFGQPLARQGVIQEWIAEARVRIEQARLLTLKTAWLMDTVGKEGARVEISAIKIVAPAMATWVIDRAIQAHGAMGFTNDTPLALMWAHARTLQMADGPDEVHKRSLARRELRRYAPEE